MSTARLSGSLSQCLSNMAKQIRHSTQRDSIYSYLTATDEHPSAEMVYEELKKTIPSLSLGTVYRNLKQLEELGKICRVATVNGIERYDAYCDVHAHFICTKCEAVSDFDEVDLEQLTKYLGEKSGKRVERIKLSLSGVCEHCLTE